MFIADCHVAVELASRTGPFELLSWEEGQSIWDTFEVGGKTVIIRPNGGFGLKDLRRPEGKDRCVIFEADRSTMPTSQRSGSQRFMDKLKRYMLSIHFGRLSKRHEARGLSFSPIHSLGSGATTPAERPQHFSPKTICCILENILYSVPLKRSHLLIRRPSSNRCCSAAEALISSLCSRTLQEKRNLLKWGTEELGSRSSLLKGDYLSFNAKLIVKNK
jgi:hypothetical protein